MKNKEPKQRAYNVWDDNTLIGRVYLGKDGQLAWDVALEPYAIVVLAEQGQAGGAPQDASVAAAHTTSSLASAISWRVGPESFDFPEGVDPNGLIDMKDQEAMVAMIRMESRKNGFPTMIYDSTGEQDAWRKRRRQERAKEEKAMMKKLAQTKSPRIERTRKPAKCPSCGASPVVSIL